MYYGLESLYINMIELIALLGNVGSKYAKNRHNAAWIFADSLSWLANVHWQHKFRGDYASLDPLRLMADTTLPAAVSSSTALPATAKAPDRIHIIRPHTLMNLSGSSVRELAIYYKIDVNNILVVHDELELPPGTVSFKFSGGLGGHNGLRSMRESFGSADFWRLRIGIGRPSHRDVAGWVLSDFSLEESILMASIFPPLGQALSKALSQGPKTLLPLWNKKKLGEIEVGKA